MTDRFWSLLYVHKISQRGPVFARQKAPPLMWIPSSKLHSTFPMMLVFFSKVCECLLGLPPVSMRFRALRGRLRLCGRMLLHSFMHGCFTFIPHERKLTQRCHNCVMKRDVERELNLKMYNCCQTLLQSVRRVYIVSCKNTS